MFGRMSFEQNVSGEREKSDVWGQRKFFYRWKAISSSLSPLPSSSLMHFLSSLTRRSHFSASPVAPLFYLILKDGRIGIVEDSTAVFRKSEEAFRKVSRIGVLVDLLDSATESSMRTKENAVSALLNLVMCGGDKVVAEVRGKAERATDGLTDVAENGSTNGKNKAVALLKEEGFAVYLSSREEGRRERRRRNCEGKREIGASKTQH